ncbi:MAG: N-6 DNA methylase [Gordonia sp. (in: high G+C Gram-positive bacteria)]|uniref:HsdM family class I SAM-dependent methyltransferase n=1 Tax=Gordonia sp. (in: high G+C Gram-positive bacteria) TaxID=84139 RepID=UPI0039E56FDC
MTAIGEESVPVDTATRRKTRGAFFTPAEVADFIVDWAVRNPADLVLEPSAGEAAFLVPAAQRLRSLDPGRGHPEVHGVEIHAPSAETAIARVRGAGAVPVITVDDFFAVEPTAGYDAVVGNPPYIRFQDFTGESRARAKRAALHAGVALSGLASSWAAFTVHATRFLRPGGRLGLVLPGELMSVNYAGPVRRYLFDRFASVELVLFDEQVFPDAETEVVLVLADGFGLGPTDHAVLRSVRNTEALAQSGGGRPWVPADPAGKWTGGLVDPKALAALSSVEAAGAFGPLTEWGETTLGMVTGNNRYFTMSPERAAAQGLVEEDLLVVSPPGSAHLRGLALTAEGLDELGRAGKSTRLFAPGPDPSPAAERYIDTGEALGVDSAYKCRVRSPWYRVPLLPPADLLLTCMNADTPRLTTNAAGARHLNSVHGVYLHDGARDLGRRVLPLASLNSLTLLHAELVGRSYGGGVLKMEPREADLWLLPSMTTAEASAERLGAVRKRVSAALKARDLGRAVDLVDEVLFDDAMIGSDELSTVRSARRAMAERRTERGRSRG